MKPLSDQIEIRRYADSLKQTWDRFVPTTKNRSFLFLRDYMDYHRERFSDHSLLFLVNRRLLACLPAHVADGKLCSHLGLTFGGLLLHRDIRLRQVQGIVRALCGHLRTHGLTAALYRPMPHPYHEFPAEEDIASLHAHGATVVEARATLCLRAGPPDRLARDRRRELCRDEVGALTIRRSTDFRTFMRHCARYLARRFGSEPVHSEDEMALLASRFPDNIQLYVIERGAELLAGQILYRHGSCAKLQYGAPASDFIEEGIMTRLDTHLLTEVLPAGSWLDFGHSHDPAGRFNEGVHQFKESMGARTVTLATYNLPAEP